MSYVAKNLSRAKVNSRLISRIIISIKAIAIANLILWIGNIAYALVEGESIFPLFIFDFDLGLLLVFSIFITAFASPITLGFAALGWLVAGIYVRKVEGEDATQIIMIAAILPTLFFTIILSILLLTLFLTSELIVFLPLILILILGLLLTNIGALAIAVPGLFISSAISHRNRLKPQQLSQPNYLVLEVIPNEKQVYCPFRMVNYEGCAFLGYQAPKQPLICDYESQWKRCYIYARLYDNLDEELKI